MLLYFPHMHPDLVPGPAREALPPGLRFLDPGLADKASALHHFPELAPFDRRTALALLSDTLRFGEALASPRDIAAQGLAQQAAALHPESSRAVLAEVEQSLAGAAPVAGLEEPVLEARRKAQVFLALAWNLEERLLDLRRIGEGLRDSWGRLDESVSAPENALAGAPGHEAEESDEADQEALHMGRLLSGMTLPDTYAETLPWRRMLEAFAVLAPGADLATADAVIAGALAEAGFAANADGFAVAPVWTFLGLDRCPEALPWLAAPVRLKVLAAPGAGKEG